MPDLLLYGDTERSAALRHEIPIAIGDPFLYGRAKIRPGVTGKELHDIACDVFEAQGYRTQRTGPGEDRTAGFQFALGHGVGLMIHEDPALGQTGLDELVPGDVLAIEPGLWDPQLGGVRFEDLVLVRDDGPETLTSFPYSLAP